VCKPLSLLGLLVLVNDHIIIILCHNTTSRKLYRLTENTSVLDVPYNKMYKNPYALQK
jgi:hypothetical protein